jgi:signal peptidase II
VLRAAGANAIPETGVRGETVCVCTRHDVNKPRLRTNTAKIFVLAAILFAVDQLSKLAVLQFLPTPYHSEIHMLPGFFRLVHWHNTGAAWSMFSNNNLLLALISGIALVVLFLARKKFGVHTTLGWIALGMIFGGIVGNVFDRVLRGHVVDFLYFHLITRTGVERGFPAFNVADSAICVGVGLLFILSWRNEANDGQATT